MRYALALASLAALLTLSVPATAIFIETPLHLAADRSQADVGDTVSFDVEPSNESARDRFAGQQILLRWTRLDENGSSEAPRPLRDELRLDEQARLSLEWLVPAEADDGNVHVTIEQAGEIVGQTMIAIGDAEPMLMAMSGPAPDVGPEETLPASGTSAQASGPGLLLIVAGLGATLALARRRG